MYELDCSVASLGGEHRPLLYVHHSRHDSQYVSVARSYATVFLAIPLHRLNLRARGFRLETSSDRQENNFHPFTKQPQVTTIHQAHFSVESRTLPMKLGLSCHIRCAHQDEAKLKISPHQVKPRATSHQPGTANEHSTRFIAQKLHEKPVPQPFEPLWNKLVTEFDVLVPSPSSSCLARIK